MSVGAFKMNRTNEMLKFLNVFYSNAGRIIAVYIRRRKHEIINYSNKLISNFE